MYQNMFLTAPDVKNIFFKALILVVCTKVKKYLFLGEISGGLEVCANASNSSRQIKF
jgi:hypothetical protein